MHYVENNWSLDCVNEYTMTALETKKNGDNYGDWVIDICIQTHTNNIIIIIMSKLLDIS